MATKSYIEQAREQLKGQLASQQNDLNSKFNSDMNDMDYQMKTSEAQYKNTLQEAKNSGETAKANYNNNVLSRGLARSSIATTGLTGIDNTTNTNVNSINLQRQSQLDNMARLKDMLRNNLTNSLSSIQSKYDSDANTLATQLKQRDEDIAYRNSQLAQQKAIADAQIAWEREKLLKQIAADEAAAKAAANRYGGYASRDEQKEGFFGETWNAIGSARTTDEAMSVLRTAMGTGMISTAEYNSLLEYAKSRPGYAINNTNPYLDNSGKPADKMTGNQIWR